MKARYVLFGAVAAALSAPALAQAPAVAQSQATAQPVQPAAAPVRVEVPQSGLTFNFQDIDRNRDNSISVEEWNAFVASLQARMSQRGTAPASSSGGSAAAGGTAQPQSKPLR